MMRKMTELGGGEVPEAMTEMMARLEKGEDPDKLEEEYGDALEGFDPLGPEGDKGGADTPGRVSGPRRSAWSAIQSSTRWPNTATEAQRLPAGGDLFGHAGQLQTTRHQQAEHSLIARQMARSDGEEMRAIRLGPHEMLHAVSHPAVAPHEE